MSENGHPIEQQPGNMPIDYNDLNWVDLDSNKPYVESTNMVTIKPAGMWIDEIGHRPSSKMLFSEFWHEGEMCILFSDTNCGKSILALQIADSISKGIPIPGFTLEAEPQTVCYFDFKLSDLQFRQRYTDSTGSRYAFNDNLLRVEANRFPYPYLRPGETDEDFLYRSISQTLSNTNSRILIIDNITSMQNQSSMSRDAAELLRYLRMQKLQLGISILVLAQTPRRVPSKPLTRNDLQGNKLLIDFCDSAFAMGESALDKSLRYIKQIKQRNTEAIYDARNTCVCRLCKTGSFLHFCHLSHSPEFLHLSKPAEQDKKIRIELIFELSQKGWSYRKIAAEIGTSHATVKRIIDARLEENADKQLETRLQIKRLFKMPEWHPGILEHL